jgi:glycosyltransferase involved in cell wall biosynthesis
MRIFFFARRYPVPYKPYYDAQFADLVARGHDITIFAGGTHDRVLNEKVNRHRLLERTSYFPPTARGIPGRLPAILKGLIKEPGRLLADAKAAAAQGSGFASLTQAVRMFSVRRAPPDICFIHGLGTATMMPWLRSVYENVPIALYYHGGEVPTSNEFDGAKPRVAFEMCDVVFTNTEFSRAHAIERGCPPEKVMIVPVGFDLADYTPPADRQYRSDGTLRLLSAGRMSEEKGFIFALQAIKQLVKQGIRDVHYSLTGEGYLRPTLEAYVRTERLEPYVTFLGTLTTEGVIRAMSSADVLVLPSIQVGNWVENQACAVQEAMLMKALVVTSRTGGVPESIPQEMRPYVVSPGDSAELARALAAVHRLSVDELARLGEQCRRFVVEHYDVRRLNDRMLETTLQVKRSAARQAEFAPHAAAL